MQRFEAQVDEDQLRELTGRWWLFLVAGGLSALIGLVILFWPKSGIFAIAVLVATGLIVSGITQIAAASRWQQRWIPYLWGGLSLAAGIATVAWPGVTLWALAVLIGVSLLLRGIVRGIGSVVERPPAWGLQLAIGVVETGLGVAALAWPGATLVVLAVIMGLNLLLAGILEAAFAFQVRSLGEGGPPPAVA